ncbi:MAG TPA: two pore domain potassium channel family protein [Bacteroidetes bacterium]|nr:two pore domain potassium channel family protein [Bacteroidota bacterium]
MKNDAQYLPDKNRISPRIFLLLGVVLILTLFGNNLFPQNEKETISVSELIRRMQADSKTIEISNVTVEFRNADKKFAKNKIFSWIFTIKPGSSGPKKVYFYDCNFNTGKKAPLIFEGWNFKKMNMTGCTLQANLSFKDCKQTGRYPMLFENNTFHDNLQFEGKDSLASIQFLNCRFEKQLLMETNPGEFEMDNCVFDADTVKFGGSIDGKTLFQLSFNGQKADEINISNTIFRNNGLKNVYSVDFDGAEVDKITMLNDQMVALDFTELVVGKAILIDSLSVSKYIGVQNLDFPESNTNIPWYNFGGEKLAIFQLAESGQIIPYQAKTKKQLMNTLLYNDLLSAYNKLNAIYHSRGDITSANRSYVEIKTIETRRQKYLLEDHWDLNVFINYKLNVFLSFFSDYATNPGKSLIQSLWILLIFTLLYALTYSGWDGMNYAYYLHQYRLFAKYVKKDKDVDKIYKHASNPHRALMKQVRKKYIKAGKKVPKTLRLFGKALHFLGRFRFEMMPDLIRLFNFQPKAWSLLTVFEKIYSGILIALIIISFVIYILVVKFINSFILSLNSFVVIGFGTLPEKGLAMYLSIIEGIIGWFLLMIFTITLLSQVLQNV